MLIQKIFFMPRFARHVEEKSVAPLIFLSLNEIGQSQQTCKNLSIVDLFKTQGVTRAGSRE
jgi:hypothetical protein